MEELLRDPMSWEFQIYQSMLGPKFVGTTNQIPQKAKEQGCVFASRGWANTVNSYSGSTLYKSN